LSGADQPIRGMAPLARLLARRLIRAQPASEDLDASAIPSDSLPGLSVVLAAHNEEDVIEAALAQLRGFADEIVVVDGASSDRTAAIAARFADRVIATSNKPMLEINKNIAMDAARHAWVLVLDPDERLTAALRAQIRAVVERDPEDIAGYWMPRRNYILGRWVRAMGMYPGSQLRLVRRGMGAFSEQEHHLPMTVRGPVSYLSGDLVHLSDRTVAEILTKRRRYAAFAAQQMAARGECFSAWRMVSDAGGSFLRQYVLLAGWLEGGVGLTYAGLSAYGAVLRHLRLRSLRAALSPQAGEVRNG
jgi:glycosyltransferase involved in cell wall biosynthesis